MRPYTTRAGKTQFKPSLAQIERIMRKENSEGFCLACKHKQGGVEPDARKYTCENCGAPKVFGAEELLMMGLYHYSL